MLIQKSFAKINLYLEITGKAPNGYHNLDSLMAFLDIFDQIKIENSNHLELEITGNYGQKLNQDSDQNIIIKAVNLLADKYGFVPKIKITLEKNIPIGGGLGGGSANAATALLMLNQIYNLNLSIEKLAEISMEIGSDIAFCLHQKIAIVSGIGEKINYLKITQENLPILIINPNKTLSTKQVFQNYQPSPTKTQKIISSDSSIINLIKNRRNDLENAAIKIIPEIAEILRNLEAQENCQIARMSGSGATCFGIFQNENSLDLAADFFIKNFPDFFIKKSKIIYEL